MILQRLKVIPRTTPYTSLSQASLGTLNHTSGAPEALIRAQKQFKTSPTQPHFPLPGSWWSKLGCVGLKWYLKATLYESIFCISCDPKSHIWGPWGPYQSPKTTQNATDTSAFSLSWFQMIKIKSWRPKNHTQTQSSASTYLTLPWDAQSTHPWPRGDLTEPKNNLKCHQHKRIFPITVSDD